MSEVQTHELVYESGGDGTIVDLTAEIQNAVREYGLTAGTVTAFVPGSTAGITTIEFEPGLLQDIPALMEKLIPSGVAYQHDETWHDGNGFSHLRAALIGPDVTIPFQGGQLLLGTWQQVVLLDFDNKPRRRRVILQLIGN